MRDLELEFTEALKEMEEKLELLNLINRERTLPDDLNNPSGEIDATNVTWFSDKVYELGGDIMNLGEKMMLGGEVQERWDNREENCYRDIEEKRNDHGVYQRDFA